MGKEALNLCNRQSASQTLPMPPHGQQTLCLFVEGNRIAHGNHLHSLIASRKTETKSWFHKTGSHSMVGQLCCGCSHLLQSLYCTTVKNGASCLTRLSVDNRTDVRMGKHIALIGHILSLMFRLIEQMAGQHLI